jgi:hypothetical protein
MNRYQEAADFLRKVSNNLSRDRLIESPDIRLREKEAINALLEERDAIYRQLTSVQEQVTKLIDVRRAAQVVFDHSLTGDGASFDEIYALGDALG